MFVAVARLELHLPEAGSLKEKRAVIQSLTTRLRNQFRVAVAEVDHLDSHHVGVLGVAALSNAEGHAREVLASCVRYVESSRPDLEITGWEVNAMEVF
jgi:uncharacterized protein YlxP (DUF503 family)